MGITIFSIILAIITLPIHFLLSETVAGWIAWAFFAVTLSVLFIKSIGERRSFGKGELKKEWEIVGIAAYPFLTPIMGAVLVALLFFDINKLHILWLFPIIALIFEFIIGKRLVSIDALSQVEKKQRKETRDPLGE